MSDRILLLGTDRYVVEDCVRRGIETVVVRSTSAVRNGLVRLPHEVLEVYVEDQGSISDVLLGLNSVGFSPRDFNAIQTSNEFCVLTASVIAHLADLPFVAPEVALRMRSKFAQKTALAERRIKVADFSMISHVRDHDAAMALGFPLVVKPADGAGTDGVGVVGTSDELFHAIQSRSLNSHVAPPMLAESFVNASEFMVDGVVQEGKLVAASVARYTTPCLEAVQASAPISVHRCRPRDYPGLVPEMVEFAAQALAALEYKEGVFHMEVFRRPDGTLVFGECAARRGGALVEEEVRLQNNFSLASAAVDIALGSRVEISSSEYDAVVGTTFLQIASGGVILHLPLREELMSYPGVRFIRYDSYIGAKVSTQRGTTNERVAIALVEAPNLSTLESRMAALRDVFEADSKVTPNGIPREIRDFQFERLGRADLADSTFNQSLTS